MRTTRTQSIAFLSLSMGIAAGLLAVFLALPGRVNHKLEVLRNLPERLLGRFFAPKGGHLSDLSRQEKDAISALSKRLDAQIVWSSNREDHHHIYLMDLSSQSLRRLTNHPNVDGHPTFSPDGTQVAFMRGQKPWVSLRDERSWDVFVVDVDGTNERLLTRGGYDPFWTPDGHAVVFSRGNQVIRVDSKTSREEILLDGDREIAGAHIAGGNLSPDGRRLSFSIRDQFDGVAIYDLAERRLIPVFKGPACDIVFNPDGSVLWINVGGLGGTRVMRTQGENTSVFMDLPGEYSHEYFPKLSNDGHWMVWGAAAQGHEHDRADYEIFVWRVGTPWDQSLRLTYNPSNDNSPDIHVRSSTGG